MILERLLDVGSIQTERRQAAQGIERLRVVLQHCLVGGLRALVVAHLPEGQCQVHVCLDPLGALFQTHLEHFGRAPIVFVLQLHVAQPEAGFVGVRSLLQNGGVGALGFLGLARAFQQQRQVP